MTDPTNQNTNPNPTTPPVGDPGMQGGVPPTPPVTPSVPPVPPQNGGTPQTTPEPPQQAPTASDVRGGRSLLRRLRSSLWCTTILRGYRRHRGRYRRRGRHTTLHTRITHWRRSWIRISVLIRRICHLVSLKTLHHTTCRLSRV